MSDDYSDLLCHIDVLFVSLAFLEPAGEWSWQNPALMRWMEENRIDCPRRMNRAQLWVVLQSLEKRNAAALERYRGKKFLQGASMELDLTEGEAQSCAVELLP